MNANLRTYRNTLLASMDGLNIHEKLAIRKLIMKIDSRQAEEQTGLSPRQLNIALAAWYVFLALLIIMIVLAIYSSAAELSIVGRSAGTGMHSLFVSGNVSASIVQGANNSSWTIVAGGLL